MTQDNFSAADESRRLVRLSRTAALATLRGGAPYASLVTVATDPDGSPILLLSDLAVHSRNLAADVRASLLYDTHVDGDPLTGTRVTLSGRLERLSGDAANLDVTRRRFLARQPDAALYAGFSDFAFYRMALDDAHLVAGFGRIVDLAPSDLLIETAGAEALITEEESLLETINRDHAQTVAALAGNPADSGAVWNAIGCDPAGLDLVAGNRTARLDFDTPVLSGDMLLGWLEKRRT